MEGNFKPGEPGYYEVKIVTEIEDFDPDQYGNVWYNALFVGDAENYMWLAKNKPEVGNKYYGHLEPTKSGKRLRFKTDKVPEDAPRQPQSQGQGQSNNTSNNITLGLVYKTVSNIRGLPDNDNDADKSVFWEMVKEHTEELLKIGDILNGNKD